MQFHTQPGSAALFWAPGDTLTVNGAKGGQHALVHGDLVEGRDFAFRFEESW